MRQVFFLLLTAMIAAFSLSWASSTTIDTGYALPDQVLLPHRTSIDERPEIFAIVKLNDSCESVESIDQEIRGHKVIFSIRLQYINNHFCIQQAQTEVSLSLKLERFRLDSSKRVDIYFREDEESLKYFGSIEMQTGSRKASLKNPLTVARSFLN